MIETTRNEVCDRCGRTIREDVEDDHRTAGERAPAWALYAPDEEPVEFRDLCVGCQKALPNIRDRFALTPKEREQFPEKVKRMCAEDKATAAREAEAAE